MNVKSGRGLGLRRRAFLGGASGAAVGALAIGGAGFIGASAVGSFLLGSPTPIGREPIDRDVDFAPPGYSRILDTNRWLDFAVTWNGRRADNGEACWRSTLSWGTRSGGPSGRRIGAQAQLFVEDGYLGRRWGVHEVADGRLHLHCRAATTEEKSTPGYPIDPNTGQPMQYVSGMISSEALLDRSYGYYVARIRSPAGQGTWPAWWLVTKSWTQTASSSTYEEFDIHEAIGSVTDQNWNVLHLRDDNTAKSVSLPRVRWSTHFNVYGLLWTPRSISWTCNGIVTKCVRGNYSRSKYAIVGLQLESPANVQAATMPCTMEVDFVRVYEWSGGAGGDAAETIVDGSVPL